MKKLPILMMVLVMGAGLNAKAQVDLGVDTTPAPAADKTTPENKVSENKVEAKKDGLFSFIKMPFGKKTEEDAALQKDSLKDLTQKAEQGDLDAQLVLGYTYLYGSNGIANDDAKAFRYYSMAAAQNDPVAINNLGSLYYSGIGVEKNTAKAAEWFQKAIKLGNSEASSNLAFIYLAGGGIKKDPAQAVNLFAKAAKDGNPTAQFMLGYAYYKGFSVPKDDKRAFDLIKAAADAGYDDAQYVAAQMYLKGQGTTKNYTNAVKLLSRASLQGNVQAMTALAAIYAEGKEYSKDIMSAHVWFNVASLYGASEAATHRDEIEANMKIEEILAAQANAEKFKEQPTELTNYIRNSFGYNIKGLME